MQHNQQENKGPSGKRNPDREKHDREAKRAGGQEHRTRSDPAKFNEDLPYEQQPTWHRQGEEGRYRDTFNEARSERSDEPVRRTARGGGRRDSEPNPARVSGRGERQVDIDRKRPRED